MKTLYIDCNMGAAGDMLAAALLELLPEPEEFIRKINALGIPKVEVKIESAAKCGIRGARFSVEVDGVSEGEKMHGVLHEHEHEHEHKHKYSHEHEHGHGDEHHSHSGLRDINGIISSLPLSDKVKSDALAIYKLIAEAESHVHGVPISDIHFHEVGTLDAVADIVSVCVLIEELAPRWIIASPINTGSGHVKCAHGVLPVPAPATAYLLKGIPAYSSGIQSELCTPTGAAILKYFADGFADMPIMSISDIGYGMGLRDFESANCVRIFSGEAPTTGNSVDALSKNTGSGQDCITELSCNLDDMTPEEIGFAIERLFDAGALDVYTIPLGMKKNRPGVMLCAICDSVRKDDILKTVFKYTSTIGIRENALRRYVLNRRVEKVNTQFGQMRKKISEGFGVKKEKFEYNDIAKAAEDNELSIREVMEELENKKTPGTD